MFKKVLFLSCLTSIFALQIVRHGYMPRRHKISYLDDMQITKDRDPQTYIPLRRHDTKPVEVLNMFRPQKLHIISQDLNEPDLHPRALKRPRKPDIGLVIRLALRKIGEFIVELFQAAQATVKKIVKTIFVFETEVLDTFQILDNIPETTDTVKT